MGRDRFDASHVDCLVAGKTVDFVVLIGRPMVCPACKEIVEPYITTEREFRTENTPRITKERAA